MLSSDFDFDVITGPSLPRTASRLATRAPAAREPAPQRTR